MIDGEDRALLEETVRGALRGAASGDTASDADIDGILAQLDWLDLLEAEPDDAIDIVFTALGAANVRTTALDDVVAQALGVAPRSDLAVLLPRFAGWDPPGTVAEGGIRAQGLATARAGAAGEFLVVCGTAAEPALAIVPATSAECSKTRGVDPEFGIHAIRVNRATADVKPLDAAAWQSAVALGRRAVAHQIAGAARTMLELARSHALERVQFGRPIAQFQAVRHRLAEALVAVEALEAALVAARDAPGGSAVESGTKSGTERGTERGTEPGIDTAALAKALASRTVRTVAKHCQQVLAGTGFTTEHSFHRYLKRTMVLEGLFGSGDEIVLDVGRRLLATRRVPTLIEL